MHCSWYACAEQLPGLISIVVVFCAACAAIRKTVQLRYWRDRADVRASEKTPLLAILFGKDLSLGLTASLLRAPAPPFKLEQACSKLTSQIGASSRYRVAKICPFNADANRPSKIFFEKSFLGRSVVFSIEGANFGNPNIQFSVTVEKLVLSRVVRFSSALLILHEDCFQYVFKEVWPMKAITHG